jgi:hypothetical protein
VARLAPGARRASKLESSTNFLGINHFRFVRAETYTKASWKPLDRTSGSDGGETFLQAKALILNSRGAGARASLERRREMPSGKGARDRRREARIALQLAWAVSV